jgi:pyruvate formate lyase activating enzyme
MINNPDTPVGTVFDIRRFTMGDGPGVRTTVFLKGCPLRCSWCHNPEGRGQYPETVRYRLPDGQGGFHETEQVIGATYDIETLMTEILKERNVMNESGGGVTFSGGEPMLQHLFLTEALKRCKKEGLHTVVDTNGYAETEVMAAVAEFTDLFLFDIKHSDSAKHMEFTAVSTVRIAENLRYLLQNGQRVWIRIPIVPGFNHSRQEVLQIIAFLKNMPDGIEVVQLIPYRQDGMAKYRQFNLTGSMVNIPSLHPSHLGPYCRMFRRAGFEVEVI